MKRFSRTLFTLVGVLLLLGAAAGSAAASGRPTVSLLSWHRVGSMEYLTLRICGKPGPQSIRVTESSNSGLRRLTFVTSTASDACAARNLYWRAGSRAHGRMTIAVQIRDRGGKLSPVVRRSQIS
jgi:hypothetical protein